MTPVVISNFDELKAAIGRDFGPGRWIDVNEEEARRFERARRAGTLVATTDEGCSGVIDGALLLALLGRMRASLDAVRFDLRTQMNIFYGLDEVRFFEPLQAPATIRLNLTVVEARLIDSTTIHVVYRHRLETPDNHTTLIANVINRIYLK